MAPGTKPAKLAKRRRIGHNLGLNYHHSSIWEEIKHFSWIISLISTAIAFVIYQQIGLNYFDSDLKIYSLPFIVVVLSSIVLYLSRIARMIIKIEGFQLK